MPLTIWECLDCGATKELLEPVEKDKICPRCYIRMHRAFYLEGVEIKGETTTGARLPE